MSAVGPNNDVGRQDFSRLESDGFSRNIDRDDFGIRPVFSSSLVTELVEEIPDICKLEGEGPQEIFHGKNDGGDAYFCEQEFSASFSHKFINPDVFAKILARLDYGVIGVIDQQNGD